jgi:hypothetical protein
MQRESGAPFLFAKRSESAADSASASARLVAHVGGVAQVGKSNQKQAPWPAVE